MRTIIGVPASAGVAVGPIHVHRSFQIDLDRQGAGVEVESARLERAIAGVDQRLADLEVTTAARAGEHAAEIFGVHRMFLADPSFSDPIRDLVAHDLSAEAAAHDGAETLASEFEAIGDEYFAQRAVDIRDIGRQLVKVLMGTADERLSSLTRPVVIMADDLTPSDTASIPEGMVLAFVTSIGSATSHTAILSRAMGVPAVVGVGDEHLDDGQVVIVDGGTGQVIVDPDPGSITTAEAQGAAHRSALDSAQQSASEPAVTLDGHGVEIVANIGTVRDAAKAVEMGAEGVGLLRTEFLFLDRDRLPNETEQMAEYEAIFEHFPGQPVVVRTLDVGGDKQLPSVHLDPELNPFLGKRGIRLTFDEAEIFATQIRAVLRAGAGRQVQLMFPMVGSVGEVVRVRGIVNELMDSLDSEGLERATEIEVGIMIEVPAAAVMADLLAEHVDFFSIGTNDLTQYTLAVDRTNPSVAHMADALHPAVLRLIRGVVEAAHDAGKWVGVCGELAGDPLGAELLVGLGVDELSMSAPAIPLVKQRIRSISREVSRQRAKAVLRLAGPDEVRDFMSVG